MCVVKLLHLNFEQKKCMCVYCAWSDVAKTDALVVTCPVHYLLLWVIPVIYKDTYLEIPTVTAALMVNSFIIYCSLPKKQK